MIERIEADDLVSVAQISNATAAALTKGSHLGCVNHVMFAAGNDSRSAETAGSVCTISPSEPRRTTRSRGSLMRRLANGFEECACGVVFRVPDDRYPNSQSLGDAALGNR